MSAADVAYDGIKYRIHYGIMRVSWRLWSSRGRVTVTAVMSSPGPNIIRSKRQKETRSDGTFFSRFTAFVQTYNNRTNRPGARWTFHLKNKLTLTPSHSSDCIVDKQLTVWIMDGYHHDRGHHKVTWTDNRGKSGPSCNRLTGRSRTINKSIGMPACFDGGHANDDWYCCPCNLVTW